MARKVKEENSVLVWFDFKPYSNDINLYFDGGSSGRIKNFLILEPRRLK